MKLKSTAIMSLILLGVCMGRRAEAHVDLASGPATANATNEVTFSVGHGCSGADTYRVTIEIPMGVTSVRPMRSDFALPVVEKDMAGAIKAVTWQKPVGDALDADIAFYKLTIRMKTPDQPWKTLYFPVHQTCRAANGAMSTVDWVGLPTTPVPDGGTVEPAPALTLLPARLPGWNKFTIAASVADLSEFFKDAQIVWRGTAAFSQNPTTAALIKGTAGVTALTSLSSGDEVWVKY